MKDGIINAAIRRGIFYGVLAATVLYFFVVAMVFSGNNTIYVHMAAKLLLVAATVLYGFYGLKRDYARTFKLLPAALMGVIAGISIAMVSTGYELVSMHFGLLLKPEQFQTMDIPQFVLSILFSVEMVAYSLIASLVGIQYHKKGHRKRAFGEIAGQ
jgi:hypothetical protein